MFLNYRAWDKKLKKMFEVSFIDFDTKLIGLNIDLEIIIFDFEDIILMRSTGLLDKNGKEIFEKDILDYNGRKVIVKWHGSYASFIYEFVDELQNRTTEWQPLYLSYYKFEIIGNSLENPELLEVTA